MEESQFHLSADENFYGKESRYTVDDKLSSDDNFSGKETIMEEKVEMSSDEFDGNEIIGNADRKLQADDNINEFSPRTETEDVINQLESDDNKNSAFSNAIDNAYDRITYSEVM